LKTYSRDALSNLTNREEHMSDSVHIANEKKNNQFIQTVKTNICTHEQ